MSDQLQTFREDIAYLRTLAEAGRTRGAQGGAIMLAAGLAFSGASVLQWAALTGLAGALASSLGWLAALGLFVIVLVWVKRTTPAAAGRFRALGLAWAAVGWTIFALFAAIAVGVWRTHDEILLRFFPSIILALYGAAWSIGAAITARPWMRLTAGGSFVLSVVCAYFIADAAQYLVYALALVLLAALPGAVMMREEARQSVTG